MTNFCLPTVLYGCLPPSDVWPPGYGPEIPPNWYPPQPPLIPIPKFTYSPPRTTEDRVSELEHRIYMLERRIFDLEKQRNAHSIDE